MSSNLAPIPPRPPLPDVPPVVDGPAGRAGVAAIVEVAAARDRLAARLAQQLIDADERVFGGLSPRVWLQQVARMTGREARTVLATADTLRRLPTVTVALADGRLSWSQAVAIGTAARRLPAGMLPDLDGFVGSLVDEYAGYGPDELVDRIWQQVDSWQPQQLERAEAAATDDRHLALQPDLFGGGTLDGRFDTEGFAILAEALDAPLGLPTTDELDGIDDDRAAAIWQAHGRNLADRLVALCEQHLAGGDGDGGRPPRPMAYVATTADALCDRSRTPGWLLTTLTGGTMKASAALIRRLADQRGADVRGIIFDNQGQVVGVGRKHYRPPGWLREAVQLRDLADTGPISTSAVRRADLDHIIAFDEGGPTDVDNLHTPGRRSHTAKTRGDWMIHRQRDGTIAWTHQGTGLTVKHPSRWRHLTDTDPPAADAPESSERAEDGGTS